MIESLLDACRFIIENQGEPQTSFWLASQMVEMKLWCATEAQVRDAIRSDIQKQGELSRFVELSEDKFDLRSSV